MQPDMTTTKSKTPKAIFFYARKGMLIKLKPQKHPLVCAFLSEREKQIIRWYRKHIEDEFMTCFPEYTLPKADFERIQKELQTTETYMTIFLHDMFHPLVRFQNETTAKEDVQNK
jgi:hypothetical protein